MATYTSTVVDNDQPMAKPDGVNEKYAVISGNVLTVNDVMQMIKVPDQARVIDGWVMGKAGGSFTIHVGDGDDANRYGSFSVSGTLTFFRFDLAPAAEGGYKLSLSANATDKWDTLDLTVISVTNSATGSFHVMVKYLTDGQ